MYSYLIGTPYIYTFIYLYYSLLMFRLTSFRVKYPHSCVYFKRRWPRNIISIFFYFFSHIFPYYPIFKENIIAGACALSFTGFLTVKYYCTCRISRSRRIILYAIRYSIFILKKKKIYSSHVSGGYQGGGEGDWRTLRVCTGVQVVEGRRQYIESYNFDRFPCLLSVDRNGKNSRSYFAKITWIAHDLRFQRTTVELLM